MRLPAGLYPFRSHFFARHGLRLHFVDEGAGPPVVLLHGNPTWSFHFRHLITALRDGARVVAPDHMGMGWSDKPGDDRYAYHLQSRIDDLEALLDHLGLTRGLTLVMQDWGGMVGMGYASRHPERVARLVVLNAAAFRVPPGMRVPLALRLVRDTALGALLVRGSNVFVRAAARVCCQRRRMPRPVRAAYLAPYDCWAHRIAVLRFPQDVPLTPKDRSYALVSRIEDDLARFASLPTLICWGERDYVFPPPVLDLWLRHWPRAQVLRLPDCGHWVLEDAPDEIAATVRQFLSDHPV